MRDGGSVKERVLRSGMWVGVSQFLVSLLNIVRSVVLARLLTPEMFGLMGLASIAIQTIENVTRPGVGQALIARQREFEDASGTAFTLLVLRGVLLAFVIVVVAPWIADFYEAEELAPMMRALCFVFLIGSLANINTIALSRQLEFRQLTYLGQVTNLAGTLGTIYFAYALRSAWALVFGQILSITINTGLSYWFIKGRLRFTFNRAVARELLTYGRFITGSSIIVFVATQIDSAVIGKWLGTHELGLYTLAATISSLVTLSISRMASSVMMPAYSRLQEDRPALRRAFLRTLTLVMFVVLPASFGLIVAADSIVGVVYGEQWVGAVVPLQILAIFGIVRTFNSFTGYLFEGVGKPKIPFYFGIIRLSVIAPLIIPMIYYMGLSGAAITVTIGSSVQWVIGLRFLRTELEMPVKDVLSAMWRPLWTAGTMALGVKAIAMIVDQQSIAGLATMIVAGVVLYVALNIRFVMALRHERF